MPTYEPADDQVIELAKEILSKYDSHAPLLKHKVKFDFVFAHPTVDENGEAHGDAIKKHGVKALGLCRIVGQLYWPDLCGPVAQSLKEKVLAPFQIAAPRRNKALSEPAEKENLDVATP